MADLGSGQASGGIDQIQNPLADPVARVRQGICVPQPGSAIVGSIAKYSADRFDKLVTILGDMKPLGMQATFW